ncbi:MAG: arylsulfatase [Planctomycetota bacterium]
MRSSAFGILCLACWAGTLVAAEPEGAAKESPARPNIVLIMADDMGYSDLGCYGGEIHTPNLDRLAAEGLRFTQFYNNAKCNPTRASLLTGQHSHIVGVGRMEHGITFGELLQSAGYRTICSGKWHQNPIPTTRGFDRYYGLADGCCNYWNPGTEARPGEGPPGGKVSADRPRDVRRWCIESEVIEGYTCPDKDFYTTDAFTTYAIERLEEYKDEDKPFVLYLAYTSPHYPLHAWPADIAKYRGKYLNGWDVLREDRYRRMVEMGIFDGRYAQAPRESNVEPWESLDEATRNAEDLNMAVYAAMIDRMDQNIGRLLAKLKELGKDRNTLIMFLTDNGGCAENVNTTPQIPPGPVEGYRTLGPGWANACNTPYRKYKATDYEGGACTPFIACWPGVIAPGTITEQVGHIIDVLPTMAELAGANVPEQFDGRKLKPVAGKSLAPIFNGRQREPHETLYWEFGKAAAVRQGEWKLVKYGSGDWELYNLADDRTELTNLAGKQPERVKRMGELWQQWKAEQ